jgi:hypothetical protein
MLVTIESDGSKARIRLGRTGPDEPVTPRFEPVDETQLS